MAAPDVQDTSLSRVQRDIGADGDLLPWYQVLKPKPHERRHNYLRRYVYRGVDELRRQQKCEEETPTPPQILDRMI
jgi:hypothetical protein